MIKKLNERIAMANSALGIVPPLIRASLSKDRPFKEEHCLKAEAMITFEPSGVCVHRSEFFDAIHTILAEKVPAKLIDKEDRTWNLTNEAKDNKFPKLVLSSNQQRIDLPDYSVLSNDASTRIRFLDQSASDVNLPPTAQEEWRSILKERALEENEVDDFYCDLSDTQVHVERTIIKGIEAGECTISSLVPNSRRFFERLVGAYDGSASIQDYADGRGREIFEQLAEWRPYEGFLFSLLLSSHAAMTSIINVDHLDHEDLKKAFELLINCGDPLSRLGALEVGLHILPDRPEVESFLLRLIYLMRDDDVESDASEFRLFSALFVLVDGELARTRIMAGEPPFYRRLASLAQAALIHRQLVQYGIDYQRFSEWAVSSRVENFYMQTLADLRVEPRWEPDLVAAPQMQEEFFGRIINEVNNFQANIGEGELKHTVFGDGEQSLINLCEFPRPYYPGPLEGAENSPNFVPEDIGRIIEKKLNGDEMEAVSFIALCNSAMIYRVTPDHAELAAKALRLANYTLANLEDKFQLVDILNGLATVAAVARAPALADELRILVRRYRRDAEYGFSIEVATRICLVASASRQDMMEWRQFTGDWLTELAFSELEGDEFEVLHSNLLTLMHSVPELWISCARADAALKAIRFR
ncbi:hypothetical protein [Marinimicrobium sp. C2-29]|uniref:hypothetical protein n=1 Tax=Marinimicrobium sp. C2-29 TaxID=3139825 RepID=UPI0031392334